MRVKANQLNKLSFIFICIGLLTITHCRPKQKDIGTWQSENLLPLAYGEMGVNNLLDANIAEVEKDSTVKIVYRNPIYSLNLAEEGITVPDTFLQQSFKLDSISLGDRTSLFSLSLGQLFLNAGFPLNFFATQNGKTHSLPAQKNISSMNLPIDATTLFEEVVLDSGYLDLTITNGYPVDLDTMVLRLKNSSTGLEIVYDTILFIAKGDSAKRSYFIEDKTVEGNLIADLVNLNTSATGLIVIDTTDALTISMKARDLHIRSATAIFQAQDLVDVKNEVKYNMGSAEFRKILIRSGTMEIEAINTIEDTMVITYAIPSATDPYGNSVSLTSKVPPAPPGGSSSKTSTLDLSGHYLDLTGLSGNEVNTYYNEFKVRIDSSGKLINLSKEDSVLISYGLKDIIPSYLNGYLGIHSFDVVDNTGLDLLKSVQSGKIDFEDITMSLSLINPVGSKSSLKINNLEGVNTKTGDKVALSTAVIGTDIELPRAYENPFETGVHVEELNTSNSNIKDFIENKPNQINYDITLDINKTGNHFNYQDFLYYDKEISANIDVEAPLSLKLEDLTIVDTVSFSIPSSLTNGKSISEAELYLNTNNLFPFDIDVNVTFLDAAGNILFELFEDLAEVASGTPQDGTCIVTEPTASRNIGYLSNDNILLLSEAAQIIFTSKLNNNSTSTCSGYLKIYDYYNLTFTLSGKFKLNPTSQI